jgi:hypothetical protein
MYFMRGRGPRLYLAARDTKQQAGRDVYAVEHTHIAV